MDDIAQHMVDELYQAAPAPKPGYRINHAKGIMLKGSFTSTAQAKALSKAFHLQGEPVDVIVRFSNSTGLADIADNSPQANPRGMAIRFIGDSGQFTDLIGHSVDAFPAGTPYDFLAFLKAIKLSQNDPEVLKDYLAKHPEAQRFLDLIPQTPPRSYATEQFFFLHAYRLVNQNGEYQDVRFMIKPYAGVQHLSPQEASEQSENYLQDELKDRLKHHDIEFELFVQLSQDPTRVNNIAQSWPEEWPLRRMGTLTLHELVKDPDCGNYMLFAPLNLTPGIEAGNDPMIKARHDAYLKSYQIRRKEHLAAEKKQ